MAKKKESNEGVMEMNLETLKVMNHCVSVIKRMKHSIICIMESMEQRWRDYPMSSEIDRLLEEMGEDTWTN